jgi:putative transposase
MVEITTRTAAGRLLLRPGDELNRRITSVIGRALDLYPVSLHAFVFMSNHWHALLSVLDAARLSDFLRHVNGNVAKAVHDVVGWEGPVWGRRTQVIAVLDDEAADARYRYILAHGAKEGLVTSPLDWPGVSSARALALGEPVTGSWIRPGSTVRAPQQHAIELAPLPAWARMSSWQRRERTADMVREIAAANTGRPVVGAALILRQDPLDRAVLERTPAPLAHVVAQSTMNAFLSARRSFLGTYRAAAQRLLAASVALVAGFPAGAIPPRPNATPASSTIATTSSGATRAYGQPGASRVGERRSLDGGEKVGANLGAPARREVGPARDEMSNVDVVPRVRHTDESHEHGAVIPGGLLGSGEHLPAHRPGCAEGTDLGADPTGAFELGCLSDDSLSQPESNVGDQARPQRSVDPHERGGAGVMQGGHEPGAEGLGACSVELDVCVAEHEGGEVLVARGAGVHEAPEMVVGDLSSNVAERLDDRSIEGFVLGPDDGHGPEYAQDRDEASESRRSRGSHEAHG